MMDQLQSRNLQTAFLVLLSTLMLIVSACAAPATPATAPATVAPVAPAADATTATETRFPLTITDAVGQEFTFDAPPKLGCWWAGCTEMLADLGVPAHAASVTEETSQSVFLYPVGLPPQNVADTQNPELWAAAEVDLILMRVPADPAQEPLKAAAPIFYLHHPSYGESAQSGYQAFVENLHLLGQLTARPAEAEAAIARFMTVMDNLRALSTPETAAQTVAVLFQGEEYRMIGPGNPFCVALAEVGLGQCVGEGNASYELNAEEFLSLDPDWLVYQFGDGSYADRTDPVWSQLTAVKEGRVYDAKNHRYYCCSLRGLILALQEFAHYTLPEANIPDPGPWLDFDPLQSPLVQPSEATVAPATSGTRTVTHELGVTEVPANPQRIVVLSSAALEFVATLGIKPVGVAAWVAAGNVNQVPPHINAVMDLSDVTFLGSSDEPNLESIAAVDPDLILMTGSGYYQPIYAKVSQIAPTVAFAAWPDGSMHSTWQDYFINTAMALGKEAEAQVVIAAWQERIAQFKAAAALDETRISVTRLMPDTIMTYLKGSYSGTVLEAAGVNQTEAQEIVDFATNISMEQLPLIDGDRLLLIQSDPNAAIYNQLLASPLWQQLGAVQADQVYLVNTDVWIGGDGYISANLILDDLERLFLEDGAGLTKAE